LITISMEGSMARPSEKMRDRGAESDGARTATAERIRTVVEDAGERFQQDTADGSRHFAAMGEQAFAAWMRTGNDTLQRVIDMNVELAAWSREQLDDSIEAARSMAQCRTLGDACGIQIELFRSSMEKSIRHAGNVFDLAAQAMRAGAQADHRAG
jgi:hypothetical protein